MKLAKKPFLLEQNTTNMLWMGVKASLCHSVFHCFGTKLPIKLEKVKTEGAPPFILVFLHLCYNKGRFIPFFVYFWKQNVLC